MVKKLFTSRLFSSKFILRSPITIKILLRIISWLKISFKVEVEAFIYQRIFKINVSNWRYFYSPPACYHRYLIILKNMYPQKYRSMPTSYKQVNKNIIIPTCSFIQGWICILPSPLGQPTYRGGWIILVFFIM